MSEGGQGSSGVQPGEVVVVTGAAQGIARAVAQRLVRTGARVALWDLNSAGAEETAALCQAAGGEARVWRVDVGDEAAVDEAAAAVAAWGMPYGLVNAAGIYPYARVLEMGLAEWEQVLRVNLTGTFLCARAIGRHLMAAGRGTVINVASGRALQGAVGHAHYAATKAGVLNLTKSLALEWAPNVRVNCVIPGVTDTPMPRQVGISDEELYAKGQRVPLGRIGRPDDIAGVVGFLLGPDSAYVTGQAIAVNGGSIMIP